MSAKRPALVLVVVVAGLHASTASSAAATCGDLDPTTQQMVRGTLALKADVSSPDAAFGRDKKAEILNLIFDVKGCKLTDAVADPSVEAIPKTGSKRIPDGVVTLEQAVKDDSELSMKLALHTDKFEPGSYAGLAETRAPYLVTNRTPISVTRSEDREWIPAGIGAAAGAVGFFFLWLVHKVSKTKQRVSKKWYAFAGFVACVAGAWTVYNNFADQEVWSWRENGGAAAITGATSATTGVMAGLIRLLWFTKDTPAKSADAPAERAAGGGSERQKA